MLCDVPVLQCYGGMQESKQPRTPAIYWAPTSGIPLSCRPRAGWEGKEAVQRFHGDRVLPPPVFWLDERHRGEDSLPQLVPHLDFNLRTLLVPPALYVSHSDVLLQSWRWDSGRNDSDEITR